MSQIMSPFLYISLVAYGRTTLVIKIMDSQDIWVLLCPGNQVHKHWQAKARRDGLISRAIEFRQSDVAENGMSGNEPCFLQLILAFTSFVSFIELRPGHFLHLISQS